MHIALWSILISWIEISLKKNAFILFFLQSYFFDEQSKLLIPQFYWNEKFKPRFIYERRLKSV